MKWNPEKYKSRLYKIKEHSLLTYNYDIPNDNEKYPPLHRDGQVRIKSLTDIYNELAKLLAPLEPDTAGSWGRKSSNGPKDDKDIIELEYILGVPRFYFYQFEENDDLEAMSSYIEKIKEFDNDSKQPKLVEETKIMFSNRIPVREYDGPTFVAEAFSHLIRNYYSNIQQHAFEDIFSYGNYTTKRYFSICKYFVTLLEQKYNDDLPEDFINKIKEHVFNVVALTTPSHILQIQSYDISKKLFTQSDLKDIVNHCDYSLLIDIVSEESERFLNTLPI